MDRHGQVPNVQCVLTEYGCGIKTRIGLHTASEDFCWPAGIIFLETFGDRHRVDAMCAKLNSLDRTEVQTMVFGHPGE
jgi:hypothetical protein